MSDQEGPLPCGCVYRHPWRMLCAGARAWEAKLKEAIRARDRDEMQRIGKLLEQHEHGAPLPPASAVAKLTKGEEE